jgi:hypothetical protein
LNISKKTREIVEELNSFSGSKIKNPDVVAALIQISSNSGKEKLFYDLQFSAKYLNGLGKILQNNVAVTTQKKPGENGGPMPSAEEARLKVMNEYKTNIVKFQNYLKDILTDADETYRTELEEKFLALNRTAMVNLTTLIYDLSWLKKYNNSKRT